MFKKKNRVYLQYDKSRKVRTFRINEQGESYESDDMEDLGFESGTNLSDMEIAELTRKLKSEGKEVKLQQIF